MYAPVIQASMTFEEFLAWDDGTGKDFKQVMTGRNPLSGRDESRRADIVVFAKEEWERLRQRTTRHWVAFAILASPNSPQLRFIS
jgi:hypothetical protein